LDGVYVLPREELLAWAQAEKTEKDEQEDDQQSKPKTRKSEKP